MQQLNTLAAPPEAANVQRMKLFPPAE